MHDPRSRRCPAGRRQALDDQGTALRGALLILGLLVGVAACGGKGSSSAPDPNSTIAAERVTERPYALYSIILNPGTNGLNIGLDSAFLSVQDAALEPGSGRLRTLTRADIASADTRALRFNRGAGVFRANLSFGADARVQLSDGRSAAGLVETFRTATDDKAGRYFADLDDRTLAFETDLVLSARSGLEARATLDVDRAGILEATAGVIGFPFRLRGVRVTDPPRPAGEVLLRTRPTSTGTVEEPLAPHGFGIAVKTSAGHRFGRASFAQPNGAPRRYTAILFQAGRSDVVTSVQGTTSTTRVDTVRRPLQALGTAELVIAADGEVVAGALAPTLDGDLGLGLDQVVTTLGGRLYPIEGGVEASSGENGTGQFGGMLTLSDTGPVGGWIRVVELQLADDASFAVGIATSRLDASSVTTQGSVTTEVQVLADLFTLLVLVPNDGAGVPATEDQGSEYHYLALEPFDPVSQASMTFPEAPVHPGEQRTLTVFNGGALDAGRALGPTGGGQTFGLGQFLVGILGVGNDVANRYRMVGRTELATFTQIGSWEAPGRSDLFAGHSFQFGTSGVNVLVPDLLGGRLGDFTVIGMGGALGVGLSSFDNPAGSRYFLLMRRRVVDPIGVDVLLDLFR